MPRILKWLATFVIFVAAAGFYFWAHHTYHPGGNSAVAADKALSPRQRVVQAAVGLQGVLYDYSGGRLRPLGLLVCTDVPWLAYHASGIKLDQLMAKDYKLHPDNYAKFPGNNPGTSYFSRRVENQKVFFSDTGRLIRNCREPLPGDTVFHGNYHVTMVLAVHPDHTYDEIETAPDTHFVTIHRHKVWTPRDVGRFRRLQRA